MFQQQNDRRYWKVASQGLDEGTFDIRRADVLEASWNGLEDLDRICTLGGLAVTAVEPGGNRENDDHKAIAENRKEEEQTC